MEEEQIVVQQESVYSGKTNDYEVSQAESQDASKEIYRWESDLIPIWLGNQSILNRIQS